MRETLYLSLHESAEDGRITYAHLGAGEGASLRVDRAELHEVLDQAAGKRILLFAPATDVRLANIQVPARQPQKVLQAAPYALEEQMAEDVDTLHFAIGARQDDGSHPVAVVSRERMDTWLAPLLDRGLFPEALVPELLCLPPPEDGQWIGLIERQDPKSPPRFLARTGAFSGLVCALDEIDGYLQLADPESKARLSLYVTEGVDQDFTRLSRPVDLLPGHASGLEALVRHHRRESAIDLLQGDYAQQSGVGTHLRPWKVAAMLAAAWITLAVAYESAQTWQLGRELAEQETRNLERFQALYPEETRIVDLGAQAQQKLNALRDGGGGAPMFQSLQVLGEALAANGGLDLRSVQFRDGALYLYLTGSDLQAFESMRLWFDGRSDAQIGDVQANSGTEGVQVRFKMSLTG